MSHAHTSNADAQFLQLSHQRLNEILMHAPVGIFISTPDGTFLEANYAAARIYGYESPQDLIDSIDDIAVQIFADSRDREDFKSILEQHNTIEDYEVRQRRKDGALVWTSINARVVHDQGGNIVNYEGFISDISERKRIEDWWQSTFDDLPDLIAIIDRDHRVLRANRAMADRLNSFPGALQGRYFYEVFHGLTAPPDFCPHARTLKSGTMEGEEVFEEFLDGIFDVTTTPLRNAEGQLTGSVHVARDITDRKKAEEALRASEAKYRDLSDNLPALICEFLPDSTLTFVNKAYCEYFGSSGEELLGKQFLGFIPVDEVEMVKNYYRSLSPEQPVAVYTHETNKDGNVLWQEWIDRAIFDNHGKAVRFQSIGFDITLKKKMEQDLRKGIERIRKALGATVQAMAATVEARDPYTAGHQRRVADLARSIATEMGLTFDQIDGIRTAGIIHDLGKITVPAEILSKPGRLTDLEFSLVKMHVDAGYTILREIDFSQPVARIVHEHHERIDGSGYPRGLKGDETIIESRIVAVADVVEAMASHRPYRPALGMHAALEEIEKNRRILYDADAADACLRLFREKGYALPEV